MENRKCKVILLPTEKESQIHVNQQTEELTYTNNKLSSANWAIQQALYILSDEKIKEGENTWYYDSYTNKVYNSNSAQYEHIDQCKKIIATTDSSLREHDDTVPYPKTRPALPQPSGNFIKKYVEEYNKGNVITEVLVEYKECGTDQNPNLIVRKEDTEGFGFKIGLKPKVSQDNTIIIHPINKTYTRDEVNSIIDKAWELGAANGDAESLPEAKEELEKSIAERITSLKNKVKEDYTSIFEVLSKEAKKQDVDLETISDPQWVLKDIKEETSLSGLLQRDLKANDFQSSILTKIIEAAPKPAGTAANDPETYYVSKKASTISSEEELDDYLGKLREEMLELIKNKKTTILK